MSKTSRAAAAVVATIAVLATGACSGSDSAGGPVELEMWAREGDNAAEAQMEAFNASQSEIRVTVTSVDSGQYLTKLANAVRSRNVPDLLNFDIINAPLLATQGQLLDLTGNMEGLENADTLVPGAVEAGTLDGAVYSLPAAMTSSQMFWNKSLFEQAGLDPETPPANLAEVKQFAQQIEDELGEDVHGFSTVGGTGQAFSGFPSGWADGGTIFTDPGPEQQATFSDPAMVSMVEWYADMWESGLMPPTDEPNQDPSNIGAQNVASGKVGIVFSGATVLAGSEQEFGGVAGIPGATGELSTFVGGNMAGITAGSDNPEEAWEVLRWTVSDERAAEINLESGWIAPDTEIAASLASGDERGETTVESFAAGQLPISIAYFAVINDSNGPWAQGSQRVIFQGADAATELAAAEQTANQLIAEAYSQVGTS